MYTSALQYMFKQPLSGGECSHNIGKTSYREFPKAHGKQTSSTVCPCGRLPVLKVTLKLYEKPNIIGEMYLHVELR